MDKFESVLTPWLLKGEEDLTDQLYELYSQDVTVTLHQLPRPLCEGIGFPEAVCNSNLALLDAFKALLKTLQVLSFDLCEYHLNSDFILKQTFNTLFRVKFKCPFYDMER